MTSEPDSALVSRLQAKFAHFAQHAVADDPLYVALTDAAAKHADWAALLAAAPASQQSPTLWLAAVQDRVLATVTERLLLLAGAAASLWQVMGADA